MPRILGIALLGTLFLGAAMKPAAAVDFFLHNVSSYTIVGFQTNEGSGWSRDWLSNDLSPGQYTGMSFNYEGPCDVDFRVHMSDNSYYEYTGNFCRISNLYVGNREVTQD